MPDQAETTYTGGVRIVFHCVFRVGMNQHFLVVENEVQERVTVVALSPEEFAFLRRIGIPECNVVTSSAPGAPGIPGSGGYPY